MIRTIDFSLFRVLGKDLSTHLCKNKSSRAGSYISFKAAKGELNRARLDHGS